MLDRDARIILNIHRHKLLNTGMITALVNGGKQGVMRRLRRLYHSGYLSRPRHQLLLSELGNDPMIYGLGPKGAEFLSMNYGLSMPKVDWMHKGRAIRCSQIEHTIMISQFMVCVQIASRQISNFKLIDQDRIIEAVPITNKDFIKPFGWRLSANKISEGKPKRYHLAVMPDRIFCMYFTDRPPNSRWAYFFLEADRSTMPIMRSNPYQSSFYKKLMGYWESWSQGLFSHYLGTNAVRVLTITKSLERINTMIDACRSIDPRGKGSRMFLFARANEFSPDNASHVFKKVWTSSRDKEQVSVFS